MGVAPTNVIPSGRCYSHYPTRDAPPKEAVPKGLEQLFFTVHRREGSLPIFRSSKHAVKYLLSFVLYDTWP